MRRASVLTVTALAVALAACASAPARAIVFEITEPGHLINRDCGMDCLLDPSALCGNGIICLDVGLAQQFSCSCYQGYANICDLMFTCLSNNSAMWCRDGDVCVVNPG